MLTPIVVGPGEVFPGVVEYVSGLTEYADITRRWKTEPWYVCGSESWNMVRYPDGWLVDNSVPTVSAGSSLTVGCVETVSAVHGGVDRGSNASVQLFGTSTVSGESRACEVHLSETYRVLGDDARLAERKVNDLEETARKLRVWVGEVERIRAKLVLNSAALRSRVLSARDSRQVRIYGKDIAKLRKGISRNFKRLCAAKAHLENVMIARSVLLNRMEETDGVGGGLVVKDEITIKQE